MHVQGRFQGLQEGTSSEKLAAHPFHTDIVPADEASAFGELDFQAHRAGFYQTDDRLHERP